VQMAQLEFISALANTHQEKRRHCCGAALFARLYRARVHTLASSTRGKDCFPKDESLGCRAQRQAPPHSGALPRPRTNKRIHLSAGSAQLLDVRQRRWRCSPFRPLPRSCVALLPGSMADAAQIHGTRRRPGRRALLFSAQQSRSGSGPPSFNAMPVPTGRPGPLPCFA